MIFHASLSGKSILNLFVGKADDAKISEKSWLKSTLDTVKYSDGTTEEVFGFDIPVKSLNEEFDLALLGKKGIWYDHKVKISDIKRMNKN